MRTQVQRTVANCFATLRQLRSIRRSVPASVYQSLVVALVLSRLDYGNITLIGIPAYQLRPLQSVTNAAARAIDGLHPAHPVQVSDDGVSVTACLAPPYLSDDLRSLVDIPSRSLRYASSLQLDVPRTHRRTIGDRAFAAAGPTLWNSLPHDITDCVSQSHYAGN